MSDQVIDAVFTHSNQNLTLIVWIRINMSTDGKAPRPRTKYLSAPSVLRTHLWLFWEESVSVKKWFENNYRLLYSVWIICFILKEHELKALTAYVSLLRCAKLHYNMLCAVCTAGMNRTLILYNFVLFCSINLPAETNMAGYRANEKLIDEQYGTIMHPDRQIGPSRYYGRHAADHLSTSKHHHHEHSKCCRDLCISTENVMISIFLWIFFRMTNCNTPIEKVGKKSERFDKPNCNL